MRLGWSDFFTVMMVARHGSVAKACVALAVTHATLLRHVDSIEQRLNARVFERHRGRYTLTGAGEELAQAANAMEPLAREAKLRVLGEDLRASGEVRLAVAGIVSEHLLPPLLAQFSTAFPDVSIEIVASRDHANLARRESDVALRVTDAVPDWLVGRRIAKLQFKTYGLRRRGLRPALQPIDVLVQQRRWIGLDRDARDLKFDRWLDTKVPPESVVLRVDNFTHALNMVRAGLGIALLPQFLESTCPDLQPLTGVLDELDTPLWLITHHELRNTTRVKVLMQAFGAALGRSITAAQAGDGKQ